MNERLDKFLANENIGSRKEVSALVRRGAVSVNGAVVKDASLKVDPEKDSVCFEGRQIGYNKFIYIMMNKPKGVLSATRDGKGSTVIDLVPESMKRQGLFPAGRLDRNTTGLLVITNDGDMAHRMLAPKSHVYKLYRAELDKPVGENEVKAFAAGISTGGVNFLPAEMWPDKDDPNTAFVRIREGKFHQVKRMFYACGMGVLELKRLSAGKLQLDETLGEGECRIMSSEEVESIFL